MILMAATKMRKLLIAIAYTKIWQDKEQPLT